MAPALKDALAGRLRRLRAAGPLLGMRTASGPTGMTLEFRFEWVFLLAAVVFAGRLALSWFGGAKPAFGDARRR